MTKKYIISYLDHLIKTDEELPSRTKEVLKETIKVVKNARTKGQIESVIKLIANLLGIASKFFK